VVKMLEETNSLLEILPLDAMTSLLKFQFKRRYEPGILATTQLLPSVAARYGERTTGMLASAYGRLKLTAEMRQARLEMLRDTIRLMERDAAQKAVASLTKQLGADVGKALHATYTVKLLMDDEDIESYIAKLRILAGFLKDTAQAYASPRNVPSQGAILNDLDSMPGSLSHDDKLQIAREIVAAGKAICNLSDIHSRIRGGDSKRRIDELVKGEINPQSAVEVMRVMGGYLAQGKRYDVDLDRNTQQHPHPLPKRSASSLLEEVGVAQHLLEGMLRAVPDGASTETITTAAVRTEIDSIWGKLTPNRQRELITHLARDLQLVAELVPDLATRGDIRALEDTGVGRRLEENNARPRNVIEFYRFVAGYFIIRA
jgi:hypothetical protein